MSIMTPFRSVVAPKPCDGPTPDLLERAQAAYEAERGEALRYRQDTIRRAFFERFGLEPESLRLGLRPVRDVWTFRAGGLWWLASDDDPGNDRRVWFCVRLERHGWTEASTPAQLGQLIARGARFAAEAGAR